MFCKNKINFNELKQKKWEVESVEAKNLMQTSVEVCEVFAFKFGSFICPQNVSALFIGRASAFTIWPPPRLNFYCVLLFLNIKR